MKKAIIILYHIMVLSIFSCKNRVGNKVDLVENQTLSVDTLEQLEFDGGLKTVLYRNEITKSKYVVFLKNDSLIRKIEIPTSLDYSGFSLDRLKQDSNYLLLSTEHGSRNYYQTNFYLSLSVLNPFALEKIKGKSFDKANPNNWSEKDSTLKASLSIEKFNLKNFLDNGW